MFGYFIISKGNIKTAKPSNVKGVAATLRSEINRFTSKILITMKEKKKSLITKIDHSKLF